MNISSNPALVKQVSYWPVIKPYLFFQFLDFSSLSVCIRLVRPSPPIYELKGWRPVSCYGQEPRQFFGDPASLARDNTVSCQWGGVSDKPPGLWAATRHRARDTLGGSPSVSGLVHLLTDQRVTVPCFIAAWSQGGSSPGSSETPPRWYATI